MRIAIGENLPVALNRKFRPGQTLAVELDLDAQPDLRIEINESGRLIAALTPVAAATEDPAGPVQSLADESLLSASLRPE